MAAQPKPSWLKVAVIAAFGICLWTLYAWKASHASITHDEAGTYFNGVIADFSIWSCHWNPRCWGDANNHILNTLLIRWSIKLFGVSECALRLPNLLTFIFFLLACGALALRLGKTLLTSVCLFCILTLNPYNLDFFALARGYGMALGWMTVSLYCVWRHAHFDRPQWRWIAAAFAAAGLAVMSNLTFVAYFIALGGLMVVYVIAQWRSNLRAALLAGTAPLGIGAFLIWFFDTPISLLAGRGEFLYGTTSLWSSWVEYIRNSFYGVAYFGQQTWEIAAWVILLLLALSVASILRDTAQGAFARFGRAVTIVAGLMLLFFLLNHWLMDASVPEGRKSVIYGPLASMIAIFGIRNLPDRRILKTFVLWVVLALLVYHMSRAWHPSMYREWWYDADTRNAVEYVAKHTGDCTVDLATEWIFYPATHYYVSRKYQKITLAPYSRDITPDVDACFYYVHPDHTPKLETDYVVEKNFNGRLLFKRKQ